MNGRTHRAAARRGSLAARVALTVLTAALLAAGPAQAGSAHYCDDPPPPDAAQQSRMLRLAAIVRAELDAAGARVALVARSGLDLERFGQRYSHAGLSLKAGADTP